MSLEITYKDTFIRMQKGKLHYLTFNRNFIVLTEISVFTEILPYARANIN